MSQWTRNRKAAATTLTKATTSRRRTRPDEPVDAESRSGCYDPDQSPGLHEEDPGQHNNRAINS